MKLYTACILHSDTTAHRQGELSFAKALDWLVRNQEQHLNPASVASYLVSDGERLAELTGNQVASLAERAQALADRDDNDSGYTSAHLLVALQERCNDGKGIRALISMNPFRD